MILDFVLVITVTILFSTIVIFIKNDKSFFSFLKSVSQNVILSGGFISVIQLIITISKFEQAIEQKKIIGESVSIFAFLIAIFIKFRPLFFAMTIKIVFIIIFGCSKTWASDKNEKSDKYKNLSPREREVARLASQGYSNSQIADELFISVETVKRHMSTIFEKLRISSRQELKQRKITDKN